MEKIDDKRISFALPEGTTIAETIFYILRNNGLDETIKEAFNKSINGQDSRFTIIRDVTIILVEKKIPENKLIELLQQHLKISKEISEKLLTDIKEKLIPFAKIINQTEEYKTTTGETIEYQKEKFQKDLLNKVRSGARIPNTEEKIPVPNLKNTPITDVDKNAEKIKIERKSIISSQQATKPPTPILPEEEPVDKYKEPIE